MAGNHSRVWHNAKNAASGAQTDYDSAVRHYGADSSQARTAADDLAAANATFREVDGGSLAFDDGGQP